MSALFLRTTTPSIFSRSFSLPFAAVASSRNTFTTTARLRNTTTMAAPSKQEWLVILPDYAGKLAERNQVRADHLKHTGPDVESGLIVLGGAMLEEPIREGVPPKMKGSVLMCVAESEEKVWERVRKDVYWEGGVWDREKVQIIPFKSAIREAL